MRFLVLLSEENKDFYKQRPRCLGAVQDKFAVSFEVQAPAVFLATAHSIIEGPAQATKSPCDSVG